MIFNRLLFTLLLLGLAFLAPWWLWFLAIVVGAFLFNNFYEAVVIALIYDLAWGTEGLAVFGLPFVFSIGTTVIVLLATPLRYRLWH